MTLGWLYIRDPRDFANETQARKRLAVPSLKCSPANQAQSNTRAYCADAKGFCPTGFAFRIVQSNLISPVFGPTNGPKLFG